jgi:hypothetical protein
MYRAGPARGPNPIRMKGSNLSSHSLPPRSLSSRQRTRVSQPRRKGTTAGGGEKNLRAAESARGEEPRGQERTLGATMRRSSKKSSSSAAPATAGNASSPDPSPPSPLFSCFLIGSRVARRADVFGFWFARFDKRLVAPGRSNLEAAPCRAALFGFYSLMLSCLVQSGGWIRRAGVGVD